MMKIKQMIDERGGIVLMATAIIASITALASAAALMGIVTSDQLKTQYEHDQIQEEILLRSEATRTHLAIEHNTNRPLPGRVIEILGNDRATTYTIRNKKEWLTLSNYMGFTSEQAIAVRSLITAKRARKFIPSYTSPIKRFTERVIKNKSLAEFQYFTHTEQSENADGGFDASLVKFWGPDVLYGPVHSNSDIWIQQAGGGNNNGWPTFYEKVTTTGIFMNYDTNSPLIGSGAPIDDIFRGGYEEEVTHIVFSPSATDLSNNGIPLGNDDTDIVYVKLNGSSYVSMFGTIVNQGVEDFKVYSWYPHNEQIANDIVNAGGNWFEDADHVWTNEVTIYDTIWTTGSTGSINNRSFWAENSELWIEGHVSGKTTFGARDTVFIVSDITYANTNPGSTPDGFSGIDPITGEPQYDGEPNRFDYFGLVSEAKILIRYKHFDPFLDFELRDDNCDDIMLYGAYAAIGEGDQNLYPEMYCHYDGIFTFQYHHPHGSTPNFTALSPYTLQETTYTYVDLHKYIYPKIPYVPPSLQGFYLHGAAPVGTTCGYPYEDPDYIISYPNNGPGYMLPYGTDWPWYNPVWPESANDIVFERGVIEIYGAIAQRRRGFVHRSGSDPYNHPQGNSSPNPWEIDQYHYDGNHSPTGYDKEYYYDKRFLYVQPPDYPEIYQGWGTNQLATFNEQSWYFRSPDEWD